MNKLTIAEFVKAQLPVSGAAARIRLKPHQAVYKLNEETTQAVLNQLDLNTQPDMSTPTSPPTSLYLKLFDDSIRSVCEIEREVYTTLINSPLQPSNSTSPPSSPTGSTPPITIAYPYPPVPRLLPLPPTLLSAASAQDFAGFLLYPAGPSLDSLSLPPSSPTWSKTQILHLFAGSLRALKLLHNAGYMHGDLNNKNICLSNPDLLGTPDCAIRLIDFGLSDRLGAELEGGRARLGLGKFKAPEFKRFKHQGKLISGRGMSTSLTTSAPSSTRTTSKSISRKSSRKYAVEETGFSNVATMQADIYSMGKVFEWVLKTWGEVDGLEGFKKRIVDGMMLQDKPRDRPIAGVLERKVLRELAEMEKNETEELAEMPEKNNVGEPEETPLFSPSHSPSSP
ncbi:hypothetical protein HDV05_000619 [Chytridiales sp. JEL 0842]|nr:hypothetical protein HDV05_000619 [Chytridiales sp. JEL 0842]